MPRCLVVWKPLLAVLIMALIGCVPLSMAPPPTPLAGAAQKEFGVQNDVVFPLQEAGAMFWYRRALKPQTEFFLQGGALVGYGVFPYLGGGYRHYFLLPEEGATGLGDSLSMGVEVSGGAAVWALVGLPVSVRLGGLPVWLTTKPSFGVSNFGLVHVPVGVSVRITDGLQLHGMAGGWFLKDLSLKDERLYSSLGASFPW